MSAYRILDPGGTARPSSSDSSTPAYSVILRGTIEHLEISLHNMYHMCMLMLTISHKPDHGFRFVCFV